MEGQRGRLGRDRSRRRRARLPQFKVGVTRRQLLRVRDEGHPDAHGAVVAAGGEHEWRGSGDGVIPCYARQVVV